MTIDDRSEAEDVETCYNDCINPDFDSIEARCAIGPMASDVIIDGDDNPPQRMQKMLNRNVWLVNRIGKSNVCAPLLLSSHSKEMVSVL